MEQIKSEILQNDAMTFITQQLSEINEKLNALQQSARLNDKELLRIDDAAQFLGISKSHIYRLVHAREIPYSKVSKYIYFKKEDLWEWIAKYKVSSNEDLERQANSYCFKNPLKFK